MRPHLYGALEVEANQARDAARISIPLAGNGVDSTSNRALLMLRRQILPATVGRLPGATYAVTGETAGALFDDADGPPPVKPAAAMAPFSATRTGAMFG